MISGREAARPLRWIGTSRDDLREFPEPVRRRVGGALWEAQLGGKAFWRLSMISTATRIAPCIP